MFDNKIGNISIRCIVLFYIYKFYNFVMLSGLSLAWTMRLHFADFFDTLHFFNVQIIPNILEHWQNIRQVWK